jgi:hypothetical protein
MDEMNGSQSYLDQKEILKLEQQLSQLLPAKRPVAWKCE